MFSNNTELGIMEQAYVKLKSQSSSIIGLLAAERMTKEHQIQIYSPLRHLPKDRSQTLIDRRKKKSSRWR